MGVHGRIVFRKGLKEIHMVRNVGEHFNPCLDHGSYLPEIQIPADSCLQIWLSHPVEGIKIHCLHIFAVHPLKLCHIKHSRGFAHAVVIKFLYHLLQGEYFPIVLR